MKTKTRKKQLTEGPTGALLMELTVPMIWGLLCMMLFNLIDTMFVGQLGPKPLAAMSFTFPVVFFITGTAMGMGVGASSVVSRAMGKGNLEEVRLLTTSAITLALLFVALMITIGVTTLDPVFRLLGAEAELMPMIRSYMITWYFGVPFLVLPMVGNSAIRATGDSRTPSLIMIFAGVVNLLLDPLLIFGIGPFPRMELQGAALATVIAYSLTFAGAFWILKYREHLLDLKFPGWPVVFATWRRILRVAGPAVGTNLMMPLAVGILTRIISAYGPNAVAAFGVGSRIESLAMSPCFALSTAMAAFTGQNFGANRQDRVQAAMKFGLKYCLIVGLGAWAFLALASLPIARLFTDAPDIIELSRRFLFIVPASYSVFGLLTITAASFNANDMPLHAVSIFSLRMIGLMIPLGWLGGRIAGPEGVFFGVMLANLAAGLYGWMLMQRHLKQHFDLAKDAPETVYPSDL